MKKQPISSNVSLKELPILKQLPGYIACMDTENKFNFYINDQCAYVNGYNDTESIYGAKLDEIRCKAAEAAPIWIEQNQLVMKTLKSINVLDIHPYRNDKVKILLSHKAPLFDHEGKTLGIIFHGTELNQSLLSNICMNIARSDKKYHKENNINDRSYYIGDTPQPTGLSNREMECLFYLVRGKTANQIGNILFLSKRTIESHLDNIKSKLNCATKSDLIAKAIENNLINLLPVSIIDTMQNQSSIL